MFRESNKLLALAVTAAIAAPGMAFATNGMNMEGYGPIGTGMGGASMAYDNGTAAMMNNPATLGLMAEGNRVDVAIGQLRPDVETSVPGMTWSSEADSFLMPAAGWAQKSGKLTYGAGLFAQGGMGTEFDPGPGASMAAQDMGAIPFAATVGALQERSEVAVGRIIAPLAYDVNDQLTVGGSIDFVWASMDLQMAMPGTNMFDMVGAGLMSGSLITGLQGAMTAGAISQVYAGYFDFSDSSDFTGEAKGSGFAGKLGMTFKINPQLTVGATYHSKTSLGDLEGDATLSLALNGDTGYFTTGTANGAAADMTAPVSGTIKVRDFQWPATFGIGAAFQANDRLMLAADIKQIQWSDVMKDFKMTFEADTSPANGGFGGAVLNATMPQNWDDQTVIQLGGSYKATDAVTVRAGINHSANPIPDSTVHYLFPAIVETHYTAGVGYAISAVNDVNFSFTYAPEVTVDMGDSGAEISHSQTNWQLMYSHRF